MTQTQEPLDADLDLDLAAMTGMEQLEAITDGRLPPPPISATLGLVDFGGEVGAIHCSLDPEHRHYNPLGSVHGGVLATLLDTAAACSVHSTLAAGELYTSMDLTVKFLRPATVDSGRLTATGRVIQRGRRTALAEAQVHDAAGKLVAHATSSCLVFS